MPDSKLFILNVKISFKIVRFFFLDEHYSNPMAPANYRAHDEDESGPG